MRRWHFEDSSRKFKILNFYLLSHSWRYESSWLKPQSFIFDVVPKVEGDLVIALPAIQLHKFDKVIPCAMGQRKSRGTIVGWEYGLLIFIDSDEVI